MDELLKTKYYKLIHTKDFNNLEAIGKLLADMEDILTKSHYHTVKEHLITISESIKESEPDVYKELTKDINSGLIGGSEDGR